jgi:cob(I)alamin adenosyltransferase
MKIYTKTGDKGKTSLFSGERLLKSNSRIKLYGTLDEMLAVITLALEFEPPTNMIKDLDNIREMCFKLSADFAAIINKDEKIERISVDDVTNIEHLIDKYSDDLPELSTFVMPGGSKCSSFLNLARTICRRAERIAVELSVTEKINSSALLYLNRLSDYLFMAMRYCIIPQKEVKTSN